MQLNIVIADDHPVARAGMRIELERIGTLNIIGEARDSTEIVELLEKHHCDILITDYVMPGGRYGDGIKMLSYIRRRYPALKIIVFTALGSSIMVEEIVKLGIPSILSKSEHVCHLITAIHVVYFRSRYFSPQLHDSYKSILKKNDGEKSLSAREMEVVRMFISGYRVNDIAQILKRSKQTVSSHKLSAMRKLGVSSNMQLLRAVNELGLSFIGKAEE